MSNRRVHAAQVHAANRRREAREAAARAARDLLALEALANRGRLDADDELLGAAWQRFETALAAAAPHWNHRTRRFWRHHPAELAETLR